MSRPHLPAAPSAPVFSDTDRDMLRRAQAVRAGNALRGWLDAEIIWPPENA